MAKKAILSWRRWMTWIMASVLVISLATWYFTRDVLPPTIRIATAVKGGLYHEVGEHLDELLESHTGHEVRLQQTHGSKENCERLRRGEIDVAIVQAGSVDLHDLAVVTPLHHDIVVVLVRRDLVAEDAPGGPVTTVADLAKRRVIVGLPDSGMQASGNNVLKHYGIADDIIAKEVHFTEMLQDEDGQYDAAVVTTGLEADNLGKVLATGRYDILPLDARALERRFGHFRCMEIPSNLWPPIPAKTIRTVATPALVVVRQDASARLVNSLLDCLHEHSFRHRFPALIRPTDDTEFTFVRLHPAAQRYHDPLHGFSWLASSLEQIAAGRELLVALAAGIFLIWDRWRRIKDHNRQVRIDAQKARLNGFLERTLRIERQQMNETDPDKLGKYLDDVTEIKLQALNELSHEELQDHRAFSVFLMQCANLISKIQLKIIHYTATEDKGGS